MAGARRLDPEKQGMAPRARKPVGWLGRPRPPSSPKTTRRPFNRRVGAWCWPHVFQEWDYPVAH
eukprot:1521623-Lingulodinium_polyedra.AAC.1